MTRIAIPFLWIAAALACQARREQPEQYGIVSRHPDSMPTTISLQGERVPVLVVTLTATAAGYRAQGTVQQGVPTSTILQDRDVLIVARDSAGGQVWSLSVDNPRLIRTTGATDPATAVRDSATITVALATPQRIASVEVTVRRGPNEGLQVVFPVSNGVIRPGGPSGPGAGVRREE